MALAKKHCVPCEGGTVPLFRSRAEELLKELTDWSLSPDGKKISKDFKFKDFIQAVDFVNKITPIAEAEGHHPDLTVGWGKVRIEFWTHAIGGLSENDFIMAAQIDGIMI